ncbi:complement C1q tumor necrosis factor-related protein 3-like [Mytilus edulis]|uniref:C1q domain-containing protein n=1 Tax=Mytilus galloprovincialis TaxID=29158 RepID=A0A8B6EVG0_MYTGA|nr:Hypothetical predicted protein [Mytilus galloprovincialis]
MKMTIQLILAFLTPSVCVSGDCDVLHGKTSCITEDLLQMIIRVNRQSDIKQGSKQMIAFLAFVKGTPVLSNNGIKFEDVETNIGNHYNPTTGVFTAPISGLYVLSSMIMAYGDAKVEYQWRKNETVFSTGYTNHANGSSQSQTYVFELKKGDRVFLKHRTSNSQKLYGHRCSYFNGYLLK